METDQICQTVTPEVNTSEVDSTFESAENPAIVRGPAKSSHADTPGKEISRPNSE